MCYAPTYAYAPMPVTRGRAAPPAPKPAPKASQPLPARPSVHVLPNVSEEDESDDSSRSRSFGARRARRARPMPLTGLEALPLEDALLLSCTPSPRAAPAPPRRTPSAFPMTPALGMTPPAITLATPSPSALHLTFGAGSFSFPRPPRHTSPSPVRRALSPASSIASASTSSPSRRSPKSPATSEDELPQTPRSGPLRLRLPLGPTKPLAISKLPSPLADTDDAVPVAGLEIVLDADDSDAGSDSDADSDTEWYARALAPVLSLRTPGPSARESFVLAPASARPESFLSPASARASPLSARPESFVLPSPAGAALARRASVRGAHRRQESVGPATPAAALDPAFPVRRSRRAPAPAPIIRAPRPPPRPAAVPADVRADDAFASAPLPSPPPSPDAADDLSALDDIPFDLGHLSALGPTPPGAFVLELDDVIVEEAEECASNTSIVNFSLSPSPARAAFTAPRAPPTPPQEADVAPERVLRSRWSTSTLGSIASPAPTPAPASSGWRHSKLRFLMPKKAAPASPKKAAPAPAPPASPAPSRFARFSPRQRRSLEADAPPLVLPGAERTLSRRDSRESIDSAASGKSLPTRKGIPVELFMRAPTA